MPAYHSRLANAHNGLGVMLSRRHAREEAEEQFSRAIELRKRVAKMVPGTDDNSVRLGTTYCNLADLTREAGRVAQALEWYSLASETLAPVAQREPRLRNVRLHLSRTLVGRAMAFADVDRFADATSDLDALVELNTGPGAENDGARAAVRRAQLLLTLGQLEQALVRYCGTLPSVRHPDGRRYIRNYVRSYLGSANGGHSGYRDLEWVRVGPPADGPSATESSVPDAD